ncbi:GAF and ANTAR domain-containing protein [Streptomyces sp. GESEQ-4]|uniref:GAF and ANTAR domain-containing protein n=1 Tax=Streptomyces sp. GESEQ-4 TaxID=2812655 RepID=UPI001B31E2A3|nr:GAF and ANTAR domain-containing protein [Streptomyces sp. GESEQ-4]
MVTVRPRNERHGGSAGGEGPRQRDPTARVIGEEVRGARPAEVPGRLCAVAVRLVDVTGATVSLHGGGMPVQLCASDELAERLTEIQATLGEGPCLSAAQDGAAVFAEDLAGEEGARRWPVFAMEATAVGIRAAYAVPLGGEDDGAGPEGLECLGTLDLYRREPGALDARDLRTARLVAGVMTVALMALPREEDGALDPGRWLSGLATEHDEIYQATGMIMAQLGVGADEAMARLRGRAFAQERTAVDVARDVVAQRVRFERD